MLFARSADATIGLIPMIVMTSRLMRTILFEFDNLLLGRLRFRLEVLLHEEILEYYPRVYRIESLRVQPTFPQIEGKPNVSNMADYDVHVRDEFLKINKIIGKDCDEVVDKVRSVLLEAFQAQN